MAMSPFQIRIHDDVLDRLDELISYIRDETDVGRAKSEVTRSDVARIALDTGIDLMERRKAEAGARRSGMERARATDGRQTR